MRVRLERVESSDSDNEPTSSNWQGWCGFRRSARRRGARRAGSGGGFDEDSGRGQYESRRDVYLEPWLGPTHHWRVVVRRGGYSLRDSMITTNFEYAAVVTIAMGWPHRRVSLMVGCLLFVRN